MKTNSPDPKWHFGTFKYFYTNKKYAYNVIIKLDFVIKIFKGAKGANLGQVFCFQTKEDGRSVWKPVWKQTLFVPICLVMLQWCRNINTPWNINL